MPFKDIATSDSIYLPKMPDMDNQVARRTLKRLQEGNMGILAPISELKAKPFPNSVAIPTAEEVKANVELPEGLKAFQISSYYQSAE